MDEQQPKDAPDNSEEITNTVTSTERYGRALALLVIILLAIGVFAALKKEGSDIVITDVKKEIQVVNPFDEITLNAKAVFVYDMRNHEVLFAKNSERQLPLASITKLMTALIALDTFSTEKVIEIGPDAIESEGDSGLEVNERWKLKDLISFTLISSSNDGASALASAINNAGNVEGTLEQSDQSPVVSKMNTKARKIGMTQTYFINGTGLDTTLNVSGSYGSARDIVLLFEYILGHEPSLIEGTRDSIGIFVSLDKTKHVVSNTNASIANIPGFIGGKTGFTDLAGGNLVIAFHKGLNHPIIISVLGSSLEGRFKDVEKLVAASFKYVSK